jgi:hypothetical protein
MRKTYIGMAIAVVVGTFLFVLPRALAEHGGQSAATSVVSSTDAGTTTSTSGLQANTSTSDNQTNTPLAVDNGSLKCRYPTADTKLSLSPDSAKYAKPTKVTFTGTLSMNNCGLANKPITLFNAQSGSVVGTATTNNDGSYKIQVQVNVTSSYVAKFAGDSQNPPATSNLSNIVIGH